MCWEDVRDADYLQEVEYLESFISLQKLRFERDVKIMFNVELSSEQRDYCIGPMFLIPFIENAGSPY